VITADFVTIDLAGFSIRGPVVSASGVGILAAPSSSLLEGRGIVVRSEVARRHAASAALQK
jgi:hypothetical protein